MLNLSPAPSAAVPMYGAAADLLDPDLYDPPPPHFARPRAVTYLAVFDLLGGAAYAAAALVLAGLIAGGQIVEAVPAFVFLTLLCTAMAVLYLTAGVALWRVRPLG